MNRGEHSRTTRVTPCWALFRAALRLVAPLAVSVLLPTLPTLAQQDADPGQILQRVFKVYESAKSYQATWTYRLTRGAVSRSMRLEVRFKAGSLLDHRVSNLPNQPAAPGIDPIPEMRVVSDGKEVWFENRTENTHFRAKLPEGARISPLLLFPQMPAPGGVKLGAPGQAEGRPFYVVEALRADGSLVRMEIDRETYRIRRIASELAVAGFKVASNLSADKETFGEEIPDSEFRYKPPRGSREIAAPPGIEALFGQTKTPAEPAKP